MAEKEKKSSIWSTIGSIVFAITVMSWIPGCGGGDGGSKNASTQYKIGETVKTKYLNVTVQDAGQAETIFPWRAETGETFIFVDASFENNTNEATNFRSGGKLEITLGEKKLQFDMADYFDIGYCGKRVKLNPLITERCTSVWAVPNKKGMIINFIPPKSKARILIGVIRE